jgi:hypothetical protein
MTARRRVIKGDQLDANTPQTPGMFRQAAINHARVGAQKIWAGTVKTTDMLTTGASIRRWQPPCLTLLVARDLARRLSTDQMNGALLPMRRDHSILRDQFLKI